MFTSFHQIDHSATLLLADIMTWLQKTSKTNEMEVSVGVKKKMKGG